MIDLVGSGLLFTKTFPGGFDGSLKADTIPELEAISDGFGWAVDLDCYPFYLVFINTLGKAWP